MTGISTRTDSSTRARWGSDDLTPREEPSRAAPPTAEPPSSEAEAPTSTHRGSGAGTASITRDATSAQLAARIAQQLAAKKTGGLTGQELAEVHSDARGQTTDAAAADAEMKKAITENLPALTADGADWVQSDLGDMKGRVQDYQRVLGGLDKGAKYIDADWSGDLSEGDVALKPGAGQTPGTSKLVDEATRDRLKINAEIVNAAWDMSKAGHEFSGLQEQTFNSAFWEKDASGSLGTFKLKPGASATQAMNDVFENPDKYQFECATATVLTFYQAAKKALGPEKFDEMAKDLRAGPWEMEGDLAGAFEQAGSLSDAPHGFGAKLVPGSYGYIINPDVSSEGFEAGWQGENVIALGDGKFYGHPFGVSTAEQMIAHLNRHRNTGSSTSADFLDLTGSLSTTLV